MELILHIGLHKTGTTSIQESLLTHSQELKRKGWTVLDRNTELLDVQKYLYPTWFGLEDNITLMNRALDCLSQIEPGRNYIYSEENFSNCLTIEEQHKLLRKLNKVLRLLRPKKTQVHVFNRNYDDLIRSLYKQLIRNKHYNYESIEKFFMSIDVHSSSHIEQYFSELKKIVEFNRGEFYVHSFEEASNQGLNQYFISNVLKLDLEISEHISNATLTFNKIELLERVSALYLKGNIDKNSLGWVKQAIIESNV